MRTVKVILVLFLCFILAWNDFIFAIIGEEFGLIGAGLVILLFLVLAYQGTKVALGAPDTFGALLAAGITTVGEVLELLEKGDEAVMSIRNFGEKSLDELRQKMREKGYLRDVEENEAE